MSVIETLSSNSDSESDVSISDTTNNEYLFNQMIKLCRMNIQFPKEYIDDMNKMYKCCNNKQKNSKKLCNLIHKGLKHISIKNKNSFHRAAEVYNELLQLSKIDSGNSYNENSVASTSNGITCMTELNNEDKKSSEVFKSLIEKCYQNPNFPNSNIEKIDKLYNSLPSEFVDSKYFLRLLKEADQTIWPDSNCSFYIHIEHVYDQLLQFQSSMMCQDRKISIETKEINQKKLKKLADLKKALRIARMKIKTLNESEMDINNDDDFGSDSLYIKKDKYEKRVVEIYKRMCKLRDEPDFLEQPPLRFKETNIPLVNKTIEKFYNISKEFPDYYEIYTLLKLLNEKKKLNWNENELKNISLNAFLKLGKRLKANRLKEYFGSLVTDSIEEDPAEKNEALKKKLDESNKKFIADLNLVREEFINKQDYAEETDGSSLNNSECEISSEDEFVKKNYNKDSECIKPISVKRKINLSDYNESEKKSKKTVYMESFNLTPCAATKDKLNMIKEKSNIDKTDKNTLDLEINNTNMADKIIDIDTEIVPNSSTIVSENINNSEKIIDSNISVQKGSTSGTEDGDTLVIDEDVNDSDGTPVSKNPQANEIQSAKTKDNLISISTEIFNNKSNDPITTEPIVEIIEDKDSEIELNELDDSDVEITSCETPRVPVQNKKSLENIIKAMNFEKKYKFGQNQLSTRHSSINAPSCGGPNLSNDNQNSNNFVNCWVMNNTKHLRPPYTKHDNHNRQQQHTTSRKVQSSIQRSITQTARHFNQPYSNSINQQRHLHNNQSLLQQHITTMTTTTTVHQVVRQSSERTPQTNQHAFQSNNHGKPELIELD